MQVVTPRVELALDNRHEFDNRVVLTTPEGVELSFVVAGVGSRFAARMLDWLIRGVLFGVIAVALSSITSSASGVTMAMFLVIMFVLILGYDVVFETLDNGRTPGKQAVGIRVVRMGGQRITFWASVVRNLIRVVDETVSLGLVGIITVLVTNKEQRLGDLAAGTIVVRDRLYKETADPALPSWIHDPTAPFLTWDTSGVSTEEIALARQFLERRTSFHDDARARLGHELAERLRPTVPNAPDWNDEQFLIAVVASRIKRASAR